MRFKEYINEKFKKSEDVQWVDEKILGKAVADNPRLRKEIDDLKNQIKTNQWILPLAVTTEGFIVDGFHRLVALRELGYKKIPIWVGTQYHGAGRLRDSYPGLTISLKGRK